ncbi:MAG: laccase domain-containing protein [Candidatus Kapaibacterium sp.]|nr:MAG: laccase domain-containing protein [Candidatus Kapabacteria bacterium]
MIPSQQEFTARVRIERPHIFPSNVVAGVTERNAELFPTTGFSLLKAQILSVEEVEQHRALFAHYLGVKRETVRFQQQVHGDCVCEALLDDPTHEPFIESDGLMYCAQANSPQTPDLTLCVGIADCAAILLYDPQHKAIAAIHSGWRGTATNIVQKGIQKMYNRYGTDPASLLAYISPCASGKCYVVREDVAKEFDFCEPVIRRMNAEEFLFDNRVKILHQLVAAGVKCRKVELSQGCTMTHTRYHSHRRDGAAAGRMVAFIGLKNG